MKKQIKINPLYINQSRNRQYFIATRTQTRNNNKQKTANWKPYIISDKGKLTHVPSPDHRNTTSV